MWQQALLPAKGPGRPPANAGRPPAGIEKGDLVAVSVGLELPGSDRYAYTRGTVLGSGGCRVRLWLLLVWWWWQWYVCVCVCVCVRVLVLVGGWVERCGSSQRRRRPAAAAAAHAEHEAKQVEALGGQAPDRSRLFIGIGRAELSRTEFFQVGCCIVLCCTASCTAQCTASCHGW